ncbi:MAG: VWA domain-containing protein [Pseudomonadota bacterium]
MRNALLLFTLTLLTVACASSEQDKLAAYTGFAKMAPGALQVQIQPPSQEVLSTGEAVYLDVEGIASAIGGVRHLDIMLVMDRSQSLLGTDPDDYRSAGAVGFVESLSPKSDTLIGVVGFDSSSALLQSLTADRGSVVEAFDRMKRSGGTNIAAGIETALAELEANGRPGSSRLIMLFTDGKSNQRKAREATRNAIDQGVTVHTMLLGDSGSGAAMLEEIALATGGSFVQVTDPAKLPEAFMNLRTTGVEQVSLSVNGAPAVPATLTGGTFSARLPLAVGENRIVARATSLDEQTTETILNVPVRDASCAALDVAAVYEGLPAMSLNERAVEIVIDASRSMWGRMDGEPKMDVARNTMLDAADWLPQDLDVAVRAYGSVSPSETNDCSDTELLVPFGSDDRDQLRGAVATLKPRGQTPIALALERAGQDFAGLEADRAVVLVTDGIESCGGDPVSAARALAADGVPVHVIGFGLGNDKDEDTASLEAIAEAAGGRFVTAGSADELKKALEATVGTPYRVLEGQTVVAESMLGNEERIYLPEGSYRVELDSVPPYEVPLTLEPRDALSLKLEKTEGAFSFSEQRGTLAATSCEQSVAWQQRQGRARSVSAISVPAPGS